MEITFRYQYLADAFAKVGKLSKELRSNPQLVVQYIKTVNKMRTVSRVEELMQISGLRYKRLSGNLAGLSAVRINQQYRLLFREIEDESMLPQMMILEIEEISKHYE